MKKLTLSYSYKVRDGGKTVNCYNSWPIDTESKTVLALVNGLGQLASKIDDPTFRCVLEIKD